MATWIVRKYHKKKDKLLVRLREGRQRRIDAPLVAYADACVAALQIHGTGQSSVVSPKTSTQPSETRSCDYPAIHAWQMKCAVTHPLASAILLKNRLAVPEYYMGRSDRVISDGAFFRHQAQGGGVLYRDKRERIKRGIRLFGNGSMNWYHWLIEILPAAYLAGDLPGDYAAYPLLVPAGHADIPNFGASLALLADGREILAVPHKAVAIDDLVVIDEIVKGPMNMVEGRWPVVEDYAQNVALLRAYRDALVSRVPDRPSNLPRRIFLFRGNNRRTYNQDEVAQIAARYGFEPVYAETMDFATQVALFRGAEAIIGPSGAAFANMLFCAKGARALTWLDQKYVGFSAYSSLAHAVGVDLAYLYVTSNPPIRSTFDAYCASYRVDLQAFEKVVREL